MLVYIIMILPNKADASSCSLLLDTDQQNAEMH